MGLSTAYCFLLTGRWRLSVPSANMSFDVGRKVITGTTDNGVRIRSTDLHWSNHTTDVMVLRIGGLVVESYPNDVLNYFKYKDYIRMFRQVRGSGLTATLQHMADDKLRLVSARIGDQEEKILTEICFERDDDDDAEEKNEKNILHVPS